MRAHEHHQYGKDPKRFEIAERWAEIATFALLVALGVTMLVGLFTAQGHGNW